jgi:hypothetical protein
VSAKEVVLDTLKPGTKFFREKKCERVGTVIRHGMGSSLVEYVESADDIDGKESTKKSRVHIARQSHVWIKTPEVSP